MGFISLFQHCPIVPTSFNYGPIMPTNFPLSIKMKSAAHWSNQKCPKFSWDTGAPRCSMWARIDEVIKKMYCRSYFGKQLHQWFHKCKSNTTIRLYQFSDTKIKFPLISNFFFSTGNFAPKQCHGSTGYCWCVNVKTGKEIPHTRKRGSLNCGKLSSFLY